jgi:hypothetical protein
MAAALDWEGAKVQQYLEPVRNAMCCQAQLF